MVLKGLILSVFTLGDMKDLKGLLLVILILRGCCGLERTDFRLLAEFAEPMTTYRITNCCLCVSVGCCTDQHVLLIGQWPTYLMQLHCIIIIVSVGIIVFCVQHCSAYC